MTETLTLPTLVTDREMEAISDLVPCERRDAGAGLWSLLFDTQADQASASDQLRQMREQPL